MAERVKSDRYQLLRFMAASAAIIGLSGEAASASIKPKPQYDHVITGHWLRRGQVVSYGAGTTTECHRRGVLPVVVTVKADLVTEVGNDASTARGRIVESRFDPGTHSCTQAVNDVYTNKSNIRYEVGSLEDSLDALSTEVFGDGYYSAGKKYRASINRAIHEGVPVIKAPTIRGNL